MKVVYNSFDGRYSDNPRALYEALRAARPEAEHLWLADPRHEHGFGPGVPRVPFGSPAALAALEQADVVISNTHLDLAWDKAPGALYLQTWHGTPLKHIHRDVLWAPEGRLDRLSLDVDRWDVLLSPNAASTGPLRQAFRYDGVVVETGYPRNDVLSSPGAGAVRDRVRRELGVPEGAPVVLYAPTWRDDLVLAGDGPDVELHLDLDDLTRRLPGAVLLLRLHYLVDGRLDRADLPGVVDVSDHPDISELYLAADVLVTDYSSVMYDFAVTGKPVLLFPYDLEHYRDVLRGFYVDYETNAPGPVLTTSQQVVDALVDVDAAVAGHAAAYARFRARYSALEDGHAAERVVDRLLRAPAAPVPA